MLIRSLIKDTLSMQGFRVESIDRYNFGISVTIVPDSVTNHVAVNVVVLDNIEI